MSGMVYGFPKVSSLHDWDTRAAGTPLSITRLPAETRAGPDLPSIACQVRAECIWTHGFLKLALGEG